MGYIMLLEKKCPSYEGPKASLIFLRVLREWCEGKGPNGEGASVGCVIFSLVLHLIKLEK